jgi:hypothetical protein
MEVVFIIIVILFLVVYPIYKGYNGIPEEYIIEYRDMPDGRTGVSQNMRKNSEYTKYKEKQKNERIQKEADKAEYERIKKL